MKKKRVIWLLSVVCIFLFLVIGIFPAWVSSSLGTQMVVKWLNSRMKGKLSIEKIDLHWFGTQRIQQLLLKDSNEEIILNIPKFETHTSLLYLIFGGRTLGKTTIQSPYLNFSYIPSEQHSQKQTKTCPPKNQSPLLDTRCLFPITADALIVSDGTILFKPENFSEISVSNIQIEKTKSPNQLHLNAHTQQGKAQGSLVVDMRFLEKMTTDIHMTDFPLAILDELDNSSLFTLGLGPTVNVDLNIEKQKDTSLFIKGEIKSANLTAHVEGATQNKKFYLSEQTRLEFILTPAFFQQIINEKQRGQWDLASKTPIIIEVEKAAIPLILEKPDFNDIIFQAHAIIERAELNHSNLGCYSLKQFEATLISLNNLEIAYKGEIQGKESTKLSGTVSITPEKEILFDSTFLGFPVSLVALASPELEQNIRLLFGPQFDLESRGTIIENIFDVNGEIKSRDTRISGNLKGNSKDLQFELAGSHLLHGDKAKAIGNEIYFDLNGMGKTNQYFSIPFLKGTLYNPYFELNLSGQIGKADMPFSPTLTHLTATGIVKEHPDSEEKKMPLISLESGLVFIQVDGQKNSIICKADGKGVEAHFEIYNFIQEDRVSFEKIDVSFLCNFQDFPVQLISPFIADDLDLTPFIGKAIWLEAQGSYSSRQERSHLFLDLNGEGAGFSTSLAVEMDGVLKIRDTRPSFIYWEMTEQRYKALMSMLSINPESQPTFTLTRPVDIKLNITQLICPTTLPENIHLFLCQTGFVGDLHIGSTTFRNEQTQESVIFEEIEGSIKGENFSHAFNLALSGKILAANVPQSKKSSFSYEGQMLHLWTKEGKFNREGLTVKGVLSLDLLPVRQMLGIVPLDHETRSIVQAVLGELINARIYGEISQLTGPLTIDIKSSNFQAKLPLQLTPHAIYLTDYVDAQITLTNAVNETLLKDITPFLICGAYSDHPLKLYIEPQGFVLPIRPYFLQGVQIGKAIIDIGKIKVINGGQIQSLMEFLNAKEISPDGVMEAWFTPIFLHLQNGVATYKRFDALLAGNVHIALWGGINLLNNNVQMTLAIASTTLCQRFKISGLSKRDMFQVKMSGTTDKLELDWSAAYTRIAFIIARTAAGGIGTILGGILEQLIPALGEEPAPSPTTDPFPWESFYSSDPGHCIPQEALPKKGRSGYKKRMDYLIP